MSRGGVLPRPILRFKSGTSVTPYEGLTSFHPYRSPRRVDVALLCRPAMREHASALMERIVNGFRGYRGFEEVFYADIEVVGCLCGEDLLRLVEEAPDCSVVVAVIPDEELYPYFEDPYMPLKRALAERGLPSQMVTYSTCRHLSSNSYVLFNLALDIFCKAGGIPWILQSPFHSELLIGFEQMNGSVVYAYLRSHPRFKFHWGLSSLDVVSLLPKVLREACEGAVKGVAVMKEGRFTDVELIQLRDAFKRTVGEGLVDPSCPWFAVEVKRKVVSRILRFAGRLGENPEKGIYLQLDHSKALLCTTGFPERPLWTLQSPVRPVMVEVAEASTWDFQLVSILRDVFWASELHWASAFLSAKLPINLLYPSRVARFAKAGVQPHTLPDTLWFL